MKRNATLPQLSVVLAICLMLVGTVLLARGRSVTPNEVRNNLVQRLDNLERKNPKEQAEIFQIKLLVDHLFRQANQKKRSTADLVKRTAARKPVNLTKLYSKCEGLTNDALKNYLESLMTHLIYQAAQDTVFINLDNFGGKVEGVYTGKIIETTVEPPSDIMNIEHTWPQSQGARRWAKSDLHHLFPADTKANGIRGNLPFGTVENPTWAEGGSASDGKVFQVRKKQRGDTARAKFYFSMMYNMPIPPKEEQVLRRWHKEDPPSEIEKRRNERIFELQHNRNPFIDCPEFVDRIKDF